MTGVDSGLKQAHITKVNILVVLKRFNIMPTEMTQWRWNVTKYDEETVLIIEIEEIFALIFCYLDIFDLLNKMCKY